MPKEDEKKRQKHTNKRNSVRCSRGTLSIELYRSNESNDNGKAFFHVLIFRSVGVRAGTVEKARRRLNQSA